MYTCYLYSYIIPLGSNIGTVALFPEPPGTYILFTISAFCPHIQGHKSISEVSADREEVGGFLHIHIHINFSLVQANVTIHG
jgi:hypothetical protein